MMPIQKRMACLLVVLLLVGGGGGFGDHEAVEAFGIVGPMTRTKSSPSLSSSSSSRPSPPQRQRRSSPSSSLSNTALFEGQIISPFDDSRSSSSSRYDDDVDDGPAAAAVAVESSPSRDGTLELTWDNVDMVLEEMRPYLIQDGGNVAISDIDGPVVRLELQGACGTCPSSTQTMKMGLERQLKERIPEISEVIQSLPDGPDLDEEQVDVILDGVRPFLQVAGGAINVDSIRGVDSLQPVIALRMEGASATLKSVRMEIAQRLQRHFMIPGLQVVYTDDDDDDDFFG